MKVAELTGANLDYWVARAEGFRLSPNGDHWDAPADWKPLGHVDDDSLRFYSFEVTKWKPSADWALGGPIIERERIVLTPLYEMHGNFAYWSSHLRGFTHLMMNGSAPLAAAMRAYVASKFGDEVPDQVA